MKIDTCEKLVCYLKEKLCSTHESSEVGIGLWANTRKSTQINQVQPGSLGEAIHIYEHRTENKSQK